VSIWCHQLIDRSKSRGSKADAEDVFFTDDDDELGDEEQPA
jgi:hypothetical protein